MCYSYEFKRKCIEMYRDMKDQGFEILDFPCISLQRSISTAMLPPRYLPFLLQKRPLKASVKDVREAVAAAL